MFRIASPLPRPPVLISLIAAGLYLSVPSQAEAGALVVKASTAAELSAADPSLAPLTLLAGILGSAGLILRLRQRRSG